MKLLIKQFLSSYLYFYLDL